jgi:phospholipid/cholesterol/gamma-HCH transport system substrate-binding protein
LKVAKEIKSGIIALTAIALLVVGVNFLKGHSFFGGDDIYYAYFPNSGNLAPASSVVLNGVPVGKVLKIENIIGQIPEKQVRMKFSIFNDDIRITKGSTIEIGSLDLLTKGLILQLNPDASAGHLKHGQFLIGCVAVDMFSEVKAYADPISTRLQAMMSKVDKLVASFSSFWDTTATSSLQGSMEELKISIRRFGNVAQEVESLIAEEKLKFNQIMSHVESISGNLKLSNEKISGIIGNTKKITDELVSSNFRAVIDEAKQALKKLNSVMEDAGNGAGTLGKLLKDDALFNELVKTNKDLQSLVIDLEAHPERYIHFSLIGRKAKGVHLDASDEKKLRTVLDSIPD